MTSHLRHVSLDNSPIYLYLFFLFWPTVPAFPSAHDNKSVATMTSSSWFNSMHLGFFFFFSFSFFNKFIFLLLLLLDRRTARGLFFNLLTPERDSYFIFATSRLFFFFLCCGGGGRAKENETVGLFVFVYLTNTICFPRSLFETNHQKTQTHIQKIKKDSGIRRFFIIEIATGYANFPHKKYWRQQFWKVLKLESDSYSRWSDSNS